MSRVGRRSVFRAMRRLWAPGRKRRCGDEERLAESLWPHVSDSFRTTLSGTGMACLTGSCCVILPVWSTPASSPSVTWCQVSRLDFCVHATASCSWRFLTGSLRALRVCFARGGNRESFVWRPHLFWKWSDTLGSLFPTLHIDLFTCHWRLCKARSYFILQISLWSLSF